MLLDMHVWKMYGKVTLSFTSLDYSIESRQRIKLYSSSKRFEKFQDFRMEKI